jgi:predicted transcriptional regulator
MTSTPGLLPCRPQPDHDPEPVITTFSDADSMLDALGSKTARRIQQTLTADPKPISEVADSVGTSIQNAAYHVDNLQSAGLVEVVGTWYSSKGLEVDVYGSTCDTLVLFAGEVSDETRSDLTDLLES